MSTKINRTVFVPYIDDSGTAAQGGSCGSLTSRNDSLHSNTNDRTARYGSHVVNNEPRNTMKEFTVQIAEVKVMVNRLPYGDFWEAVAYEPMTKDHGTITTIDGKWYGRVATLGFNSNLPVGSERSERCRQHYDRVQLRAKKLIRDAFEFAGVRFPVSGNWNLGDYEFTA